VRRWYDGNGEADNAVTTLEGEGADVFDLSG